MRRPGGDVRSRATGAARSTGADAGLGLVEMVVAMAIIAALLMAATSTLVSSWRAAGQATVSTRGTQLASEALEQLHSLPWNSLGLLMSDPAFVASFEGRSTAVLPASNPADPRVPKARRTVQRGDTTYTVVTHVVRLPDPDPTRLFEGQRRMTVLVSWNAGSSVRTVRAEGTRTPTTGQMGNQCFGVRSLDVLLRDMSATLTSDPFVLTGSRVVPSGSQLVATTVTNHPASGATLEYSSIDTGTGAVVPRSVAMTKAPGDDRTWTYELPVIQQFPAGLAEFRTTATSSAAPLTGCSGTTATLDAFPAFTHPASTGPTGLRVATGTQHSCAVDGTGKAYCWGLNGNDYLFGNGAKGSSSVPRAVGPSATGLGDLTGISAGDLHTCAVQTTGSVWCWGDNTYAMIGDGTSTIAQLPVKVPGLTDAVTVSAGPYTTCALSRGGLVRCWGNNSWGQHGNGTTTPTTTPAVRVSGITTAVNVSVGAEHACAVTSDGRVWCWGNSDRLQLNGPLSSSVPVEIPLPGTSPVAKEVAVGSGLDGHACAVVLTGEVYCWGFNDRRQAVPAGPSPTVVGQVTGIPAMTHVSAGTTHTCATTSTEVAAPQTWCWGLNQRGQLGNGSGLTGSGSLPVQVAVPAGMAGVVDLSASDDHTCSRTLDAAAWCWGFNQFGELGNGTTTNSPTPVRVSGS